MPVPISENLNPLQAAENLVPLNRYGTINSLNFSMSNKPKNSSTQKEMPVINLSSFFGSFCASLRLITIIKQFFCSRN